MQAKYLDKISYPLKYVHLKCMIGLMQLFALTVHNMSLRWLLLDLG